MVKIVINLLIIFLLSISNLFANDDIRKYEEVIYKSASKEEALKAFNNLKVVYLNSIVEGDEKLQQQSLSAMVRSLKSLDIDYKEYEHELNALNKKLGIKTQHETPKKASPKNEDKSYEITNIETSQTELTLIVNQNISQDMVKFSTWQDKNTKKYYDIYEIRADISQPIANMVNEPFKISVQPNGIIKIVIGADKNPKTAMVLSNNRINIKLLGKEPKEVTREIKKSTNTITINKISVIKDQLILEFSEAITKDNIKSYDGENKNEQIYEIEATTNAKKNEFDNLDCIDLITINKQGSDTTKITLSNKTPISTSTNIEQNKLYITISQSPIKQQQEQKSKAEKTATITAPKSSEVKEQIVKSRNKIIVLDPGHGGKDCGAIGTNQYQEKDIVYSISKKVENVLKKRGYIVKFTRKETQFIALPDRTKYANQVNADMFISVHANAVGMYKTDKVSGIETYFLSTARGNRAKNAAAKENQADLETMNYFSKMTFLNFLNQSRMIASNKLAIDIQKHMLMSLNTKYNVSDGGVRQGPFWVLVGAQMPSILVEVGYITHPEEGRLLGTKDYQQKIADGIANGIDSYFDKNQ